MTIRFQDYQSRYKKELRKFQAALMEGSLPARAVAESVNDVDSFESRTLREKPSFTSKAESQLELVDAEMSMLHLSHTLSTSHLY